MYVTISTPMGEFSEDELRRGNSFIYNDEESLYLNVILSRIYAQIYEQRDPTIIRLNMRLIINN